jgi:hypothetical protein
MAFASTAAMAQADVSAQAQAQTATDATTSSIATSPTVAPETDAQDIIVTGSRISRLPDQPVLQVTSKTLINQGYTNIGQALTDLPQFGVPANSPAAS